MKIIVAVLFYNFCSFTVLAQPYEPVLLIHGGAGTLKKESFTAELEKQYKEKLSEALNAGYKILENRGSSLEAVVEAIKVLEDSPLFNAGKGAVITNKGTIEMDASIMEGNELNAGAVSGIKHIKNPITAALLVMQKSPHVMMAGNGAENFARSFNLEIVDTSYFFTERRLEQIRQIKLNEQGKLPTDQKFGTVGAVALDFEGNLASGTSTGGMSNKKFGRIGDSPIIGAETYANNQSCAVSATGHGEFFIRYVAAYDISAKMLYQNKSVQEASHEVIHEKLAAAGGFGGVIVLDREGNHAFTFSTEGMYRGKISKSGQPEVFIFKKD